MDNSQIRIVRLEPLRAICFSGFGDSPEAIALEKMNSWTKDHPAAGRVLGFNNPSPKEGNPNYGYDIWLCVNETVQAPEAASIIDFPGGLYAVLYCPVRDPMEEIPKAWQQLDTWLESSGYQLGKHQWFEEFLKTDSSDSTVIFTLDLFLPIQ